MKPISKNSLIKNAVIILLTFGITWVCLRPSACNYPKPIPQQSENLKASYVTLVKNYEKKIKLFKLKQDSLQNQLSQSKQKLAQYQKESLKSKVIVQKRIAQKQTDTLLLLADCDSLKKEVSDYIQCIELEDSLQRQTISQQQELIAEKDTALTECNKGFTDLSQLTDKSIDLQWELEQQLIKQKKQLNRKTLFNRVLIGTTLALTSVTTFLITR